MLGSESAGDWTRGMRVSQAIAFEACRFVVAVWLALTLVFLAFQVWSGGAALSIIPHDPRYVGLIGQNTEIFALDQPLTTRYGVWLADAFLGRLGISYYYRLPVLAVLAPWIPATLELMIGTTLWAAVLGGLLGWAAASRRVRGVGLLARAAGLVVYALPLFWGLLLLLYAAFEGWGISLGMPLPPSPTRPRPTGFPVLDALLSGDLGQAWLVFWTSALLTLPAGAALALPILLRVRNALREVRDSGVFAHLPPGHGLPPAAAFRTALAPIAGGIAAIFPFVVSSVLLVEWLAGRRGLGWYSVEGLDVLDVPLVQGALTLLAILALLGALPFALLEAAFLRRPAADAPRPVPGDAEVGAQIRAAAGRLVTRPALVVWVGLALLAIPVLMTALAPLLSAYGPLQRVTDSACNPGGTPFLQPPCAAHPLGTNYFGFDVYSQVLWGGLLVMAETAEAMAVSAGIALGLALLCGVAGRPADVPLRFLLGSVAMLPALAVLFLFLVSGVFGSREGGLVIALEFLFVPILFRDARNLVGPVERPAALVGPSDGPLGGPAARLRASIAAVGPGLAARVPRRLAEMALLFELFTAFGTLPPTVVDWAQTTTQAIDSNAFVIGNWGWLFVPGLLLFLYAAGLVLLSDGLRGILAPEPPPPAVRVEAPAPGTPVPVA